MLGKIMKYEFKSLGRVFFPIYIGVALLTVLAIIVSAINNAIKTDGVSVMSVVNGGVLVITFIALFVVPSVSSFIAGYKFYESTVKSQGYLTHTLPVKKSTLVIGKNIVGGIFGIMSVITSCICFIIYGLVTLGFDQRFNIGHLFEIIKKVTSHPEFISHRCEICVIIVLFIIAVIVQQYGNVGFIHMCSSIGQRMNKNKGAWTVVSYLVINFTVSLVLQIIIGVISATANSSYFNNLNAAIENHQYTFLMMVLVFCVLINVVLSVIYNAIAIRFFDKKLNLE